MDDPFAAVAALPGVPDAVDQARAAVDQLLRHPVLRGSGAAVANESALRAARASAALEGVDLPLAQVRRLVGSTTTPDAADGVIRGALRVAAQLPALVPTWQRAPMQALARLHVLAAADLLPAAQLGRPRPELAVSDPLELGLAPPPAEVAQRLGTLARLLVVPTSAPALVVAGVTHGEMLTLRPFARGNGLVARAAQRLVLTGRGVDPIGAGVPEVGHVVLGSDAYASAARDYRSGSAAGLVGWLRHCAEAVQAGAREGVAICEALVRG